MRFVKNVPPRDICAKRKLVGPFNDADVVADLETVRAGPEFVLGTTSKVETTGHGHDRVVGEISAVDLNAKRAHIKKIFAVCAVDVGSIPSGPNRVYDVRTDQIGVAECERQGQVVSSTRHRRQNVVRKILWWWSIEGGLHVASKYRMLIGPLIIEPSDNLALCGSV